MAKNEQKIFVDVEVETTLDGIAPVSITLENGESMPIDLVFFARPLNCLRDQLSGIRYTCCVGEQEIRLCNSDEKWWIEQ